MEKRQFQQSSEDVQPGKRDKVDQEAVKKKRPAVEDVGQDEHQEERKRKKEPDDNETNDDGGCTEGKEEQGISGNEKKPKSGDYG